MFCKWPDQGPGWINGGRRLVPCWEGGHVTTEGGHVTVKGGHVTKEGGHVTTEPWSSVFPSIRQRAL